VTQGHPAYRRYLDLFQKGEYRACHDVLEPLWLETRSGFYQGLIQLAVAFLHLSNGNTAGARKLLLRAHQHLEPYAPFHQGLDVEKLLKGVRESLDRLPEAQQITAEEAASLGIEPARILVRCPPDGLTRAECPSGEDGIR